MHEKPRRGFSDGPHLLGAVTLLARLAQEEVAARLAPFGLTFSQAIAMVRLWQSPRGSLPQSELIEKLAVSRASGSLVLGELASAGLITRRIDPNDARRQIVTLTNAGRDIERDVHHVFESTEAELFVPVGTAEWTTTYRQVRAAIDSLLNGRTNGR
jgi:DNA-binding MarR family transcriptional regulator